MDYDKVKPSNFSELIDSKIFGQKRTKLFLKIFKEMASKKHTKFGTGLGDISEYEIQGVWSTKVCIPGSEKLKFLVSEVLTKNFQV